MWVAVPTGAIQCTACGTLLRLPDPSEALLNDAGQAAVVCSNCDLVNLVQYEIAEAKPRKLRWRGVPRYGRVLVIILAVAMILLLFPIVWRTIVPAPPNPLKLT